MLKQYYREVHQLDVPNYDERLDLQIENVLNDAIFNEGLLRIVAHWNGIEFKFGAYVEKLDYQTDTITLRKSNYQEEKVRFDQMIGVSKVFWVYTHYARWFPQNARIRRKRIRHENVQFRHKIVENGQKMSEFACFDGRIRGNILVEGYRYYPDPPRGSTSNALIKHTEDHPGWWLSSRTLRLILGSDSADAESLFLRRI